ncbi:MAG: sulfotransferase domain-containing protein [Leptolyngbyaceae cyanobacterium]
MITGKRIQKLLKRTSRIPLASLNYHLGNYEDVIWLVSDGRSGSTWVSDLINWDRCYRELFEPFHPYIVKRVQDFELFQYLRPDDKNSDLGDFLRSVFSGEFKHLRADVSQPRLFYKGLLVKDIFAHLLLPWVTRNIPQVQTILLIRNPFAVALSKQRLKNWTWMTDPTKFLEQNSLYEDYLAPFEDVIRAVGDDFVERQVMIWAIVHYVSLLNVSHTDIYVAFYEDFVSNSPKEIANLFKFLNKDQTESEKLIHRIHQPTRTAKKFHQSIPRESLIDAWKSDLSVQQIDQGMKILECFQLDKVYQENLKPNRAALMHRRFAV